MRKIYFRSIASKVKQHKQQGVFTLLNVGVLLLAVACLGAITVGQLAWERGRVQQIADLAALTAARQMADGPTFEQAYTVAQENGLLDSDTLTIECVIDGELTDDCANAVTARATITRNVNPFFAVIAGQQITRLAEATNTPTVIGTVGSGLINLNSDSSLLLNGLLGALGGGQLNLSVLQYDALLNADVRVDLLDLVDLNAQALTVEELLAVNVTALDLLQDAVTVGNADQAILDEVTGVLSALSVPLNQVSFPIGDLLSLDLSGQLNTPLGVNLGDLAQVALIRSLEGATYQIPLNLDALGITLDVRVIESPQILVGRKLPMKNPIATANTSQVAITLNVQTPISGLNVGIASLGLLEMDLQVKAGAGYAEVNELNCSYPRENNVTQITAVPALVEVCISDPDGVSGLEQNNTGLTCGDPADVLELRLLGLVGVDVELGAQASMRADPTTVDLIGQAPMSETVSLPLAQSLNNLLSDLDLDIDLDIELPALSFLLIPIQATLDSLLSALPSILSSLLSPILSTVGGLLDNLLNLLGVSLNEVTVSVQQVDCQSVTLTR